MSKSIDTERTALEPIIRKRRSVKREYQDKQVTEEIVKELLDYEIWYPNHGKRQQ